MFALLIKTTYGWTATLGPNAPANANEWPTEDAALAAAQSLREVGIGDAPDSEWRVVRLADLDSYCLVA